MKISTFIIATAVAIPLLIGCQNTSNKLTNNNAATETEKKSTVAAKPETTSFQIDGMTCAIGCAKTIETKLSKMDGVQKASVDFDKKQATVEFDAAVLTPEKLVQAVETTGDGETYKVSNIKTNLKS